MALLLDSEFDSFKQCFIDNADVEFYSASMSSASPDATTPSEDIWKKFDEDLDLELSMFPTPPLSPSHCSSDGEDSGGGGSGNNCPLSSSEKLQRVSELLDDEPAWMTQSFTFVGPDTKTATSITPTVLRATSPMRVGAHKSNFLIQDCMWSAIQAEERRRQLQAEKAAKSGKVALPTALANAGTTGDFSSGECVDPTSVFPYPLSDTRLSFSNNTPSDSEEEIDVVTVEKKCLPSSHTAHHSRTLFLKRHSKHSRKHGTQVYKVVKRCSSKSILSKVQSVKKLGKHVDLEDVKRALENRLTKNTLKHSKSHSYNSSRGSSRGSSRSASQASSDSEDCDRRANHNVLERRRREDLRTSFFKLRDEIPELKAQERAAKIVILKKATDHVNEQNREERRLLQDKDALKHRHRALLHRLRQLEGSK